MNTFLTKICNIALFTIVCTMQVLKAISCTFSHSEKKRLEPYLASLLTFHVKGTPFSMGKSHHIWPKMGRFD